MHLPLGHIWIKRIAQTIAHQIKTEYGSEALFQRALDIGERALHIWEQAWGAEHPEVANALEHLAELTYIMNNDGEISIKRGSEELPLVSSLGD